jgi:hypothetical protein
MISRTILRSLIPPVAWDGRVIIIASAVRSFGYGFISVFLGVYLDLLEFTPFEAGLVFSAIMAGGDAHDRSAAALAHDGPNGVRQVV